MLFITSLLSCLHPRVVESALSLVGMPRTQGSYGFCFAAIHVDQCALQQAAAAAQNEADHTGDILWLSNPGNPMIGDHASFRFRLRQIGGCRRFTQARLESAGAHRARTDGIDLYAIGNSA